MICRHCGAKNQAGSFHCRLCGKPLPVDSAPENFDSAQTEQKYDHYDYEPEYEDIEASQPREDLREKASSPDEYFISDLYGETEPYYAKPKSKTRKKKREETAEYFPEYSPTSMQTGEYRDERTYDTYRNTESAPAARRKSRLPYILVSILTALLSVFCFVLPFQQWVSYHYEVVGYEVSDGNLTLIELAKRFYENESIVPLVTGKEDNFGIESLVTENVNGQYTQGRLLVLVIGCMFLFALLLYVIFILTALFLQRGAAATFGIIASLIFGGCTMGVMYIVKTVNDVAHDELSSLIYVNFDSMTAPYAALGLSALIIVLCIVFSILGAGTKRR